MGDFNLADLLDAIADAHPNRPSVVWRDGSLTYAELAERSSRLATVLNDAGMGCHTERDQLANHESGQDHLAVYLHNCSEYVECLMGAFAGRVAPVNVNYRYVDEELEYLFGDAEATGLVFHSAYAEGVHRIVGDGSRWKVMLQVPDESGNALMPGAQWYEEALAAAQPLSAERAAARRPDDLYILYTGGTTGMPKGVLWRQADLFVAALGGRDGHGVEFDSAEEILAKASGGGMPQVLAPPFMHGAAQWIALTALIQGHTVVLPDEVDGFHAHSVVDAIQRHNGKFLLIVGDAFGRPLVAELESRVAAGEEIPLRIILNSGATLSVGVKERLHDLLGNLRIIDVMGSSESGSQASRVSGSAAGATTGDFDPHPTAVVLNEDKTVLLEPGHEGLGWLGQSGRMPLGYLGDEVKTAATFPVIGGHRYSVPGDRARLNAQGIAEVLGRDSVCINSGGEKIFAEEVEQALRHHPAVADVIVCGRPSEKWGSEVVAVVQITPNLTLTLSPSSDTGTGTGSEEAESSDAALLAEAANHVARYKLPKAIIRRDTIQRSPSGKPDYRWAVAVATGEI